MPLCVGEHVLSPLQHARSLVHDLSRTGLLRLDAVANLIPLGRRVSVGIITQPHARLCSHANQTLTARSRQSGRMGGAAGSEAAALRQAQARQAGRQEQLDGGTAGSNHGVRACACSCVVLLHEYRQALQRLRPDAAIAVRDQDSRVGALARLVFAPVASLCQLSSFCIWPVIGESRTL